MYNTGNAVPSDKLEDMSDNGKVLDILVTQTEGTTTDRLGRTRRVFQQILMDMGFQPLSGSFQTGATITARNQALYDEVSQVFYVWGGTIPVGGYIVLVGSTPATAGGVGVGAWSDKTDLMLRSELYGDSGGSLVANKRALVDDSIRYAISDKLNETRSAFEWSITPSLSDATAEINAAILDIYKLKQNVLSDDEIYSVTLKFEQGVDYHILGTVIVPSGVILDFSGSRVIGPDSSAGTASYNPAGSKMFVTGRYAAGAITSNSDAASATDKRVIGSGIKAATISNSNCPFDLTNFQEMCFIDDVRFSNCSSLIRVKNGFYSRYGTSARPLIARNCSQATGQPAILMHGTDSHQMKFDARLVGVSIGYEVTSTRSFDVEINGSMEEGKSSGSIGVRSNGAYCQAWRVNAYFEGVDTGITGINSGTFNACLFAPQYFSSCTYSFKAQTSTFRSCRVMCASIPDEGAAGHNTADFYAPNNDVIFDMGAKGSSTASGTKEYPANILLGAGCKAQGTVYHYDDTSPVPLTDALAYAQPAIANPSRLNEFAFEGSQIVSKPNKVPFCTLTKVVNTLVVDTSITYDEANILAFNFRGNTDSVYYVLSGFIFGSTLSWVEHNPAGVVLTVTNNAGSTRLTFTSLPAAVPVINVSGCVRHV